MFDSHILGNLCPTPIFWGDIYANPIFWGDTHI